MTKGHVFIATSLDGFIARRDGSIDWLTAFDDASVDYGFGAFIARIDGMIMGRGTYETALGFPEWPYTKPVIVLSSSLAPSAVPQHLRGRVDISAAAPAEIMARVASTGWSRAYVDGGKVIQSFLRAGLIDDLIISTVPVLLGDGLPLFGDVPGDIRLQHLETRSFASGLVQSRYQVAKPA